MKHFNLILCSIALLSLAQLAHAGDQLIPVKKLDQVRKQQVINEVKKQMSIKDSAIAIEIAEQNDLNLTVQTPDAIEVSNYMSGTKGNSFEEREYLANVKILSINHCMGECNAVSARSIMITCNLEAESFATKKANITCEVKK